MIRIFVPHPENCAAFSVLDNMPVKKKTKTDLVDCVYEKSSCKLNTVKSIIESFIDELRSSLENGYTIELRGFGTFELRERKGREAARNPKTGEKVSVENHSVIVFRAGRDLKKAVWDLPRNSDNPEIVDG